MAVSAVRKWWINHQLDNPDRNDPISEEDEEEGEERKRQLCINLNQALRTNQLLLDFDGGRPILRLTAPLDLVNFPSVFHPRWPIECEVISDVVHHIEWDPPKPEPFYQPTGYERTPMQAGEETGKVVFCTDHANKRPYFTCSRVRGNKGPIKTATFYDRSQSEFTLEFESRFESGNLQKAVQVGIYEYELTLRTDMYTRKHTQWFYFRVRNMNAGVTYRFTIINLMKHSSLYSQGMRPLLYSEKAAKDRCVGWQRTGSNIKYYKNYGQNTKEINSDSEPLYSLTWTLQFPYDSDTCYLAHCYPYTYSRLQHYLRRISSNPAVTSYCKLRVLCHSLAGNPVYVMTITSHNTSRAESRSRKAVVVTARVHPGETNGSWMMEGFLDFLLGDSEDAQLLRDTFVFKVVPMLNPDGVVVGNYRCSLSGRDLNRKYKTVLRDSFPSVWHTRNMVERLMTERDVILYCDFHGHNRKNNVFMYGCNSRGEVALKLQERVFPLMMSKNASDKFAFRSCKFRVQKNKEGTGRIAMWKLGIKNSYTMEATFGGSTLGDRRGTHFTTRDLKSLGFYFCDTLLDYYDPDPAKVSNCLTELAMLMRKKVRERLGKDFASDCNISVSDLETSTSGSNSSESDGPPVHLLNQPEGLDKESNPEKRRKKKHLKTHKERNRLRSERVNNSAQSKILQGNITKMQQTPEKINKHLGSDKERNRQRLERGNSNTQPNILPNNIRDTLSDMPGEGSVEDSPQQSGGAFRKKWQVNSLISKSTIPPATSCPGELTKVTLWQGSAPVKETSLQNMQASYLYSRAKLRLNSCSCTPHSDEPMRGGAQQWRCSTQLLHLNPHLQASPHLIQCNQKQSAQSSLVSQTVHRELPPPLLQRSPVYSPKIHNIRLHSSLTNKMSTRWHNLETEPPYLPEDSSNEDVIETKQQKKGQKEGVSHLRCEELDLSELSPEVHLGEAGSHNSLFVPVLKKKEQKRRKLCKGSLVDKMHGGSLSPVSKHHLQTL